jgi:hypothetical protein
MHTHKQTLNIHALSGIQIHGPGFRASKDSARPKPLATMTGNYFIAVVFILRLRNQSAVSSDVQI